MAKAIEYSDLQFDEPVGSGGSTVVYKGRWKSMDMIVAVKTSLQGIPNNELEIMSLVDHPNVLHFYGAVLQPPFYCIVTEYVEQGALFDFLHQNEFDPTRNLQWAREIAAGMKYLHFDVPNQVVIHGDLKSKNVLVAADNAIKICDFGSSKLSDQLPGISVHTTTKVLGTPRWMAPEVLENKPISKQCDVYSYAIVVWELLTHKIPFEDITDFFQIGRMVVENNERPPIPLNCSPILANLLTRFWNPDPKLRPEFTEIVSDMDNLAQMTVGEGKELTSQSQFTPQIISTEVRQHLQVPLQRPVPQPRCPRPVPRPRTPQKKAQPEPHPSLQTLEISSPPEVREFGLPKTPQVPHPRELTSQPQITPQIFSTELPLQQPVPQPRSPRPVPRPRTVQKKAQAELHPKPQTLEISPPPRVPESDVILAVPPRPRRNAMPAAIPRPNRPATPENGEVTPLATNFSLEESFPMNEEVEVDESSYSDEEVAYSDEDSHYKYEDPQQDLLSLQQEAPAETDSLQLYNDGQPIWAISREEVELLDDELGKGAWGVVRKARFRGEIVAAKRLHETLSQESTEFLYKGIRRVLDIASNLRHPNLVLFLGAVIEGDLTELIILNEFMDCSLRDVLAEGQLSRSQIKSISFDVARALNYLHSCKPQPLIHRDVSSANVLLQRLGPDYWKAKVSDYGSVQAIDLACTIAPGNPVYAAPEAKEIALESCKMDTYSFGILLIEMLTRQLPVVQQRARLLQEIQWREIHKLIEICIQDNPDERPTMQDIISSLEILKEKSAARQPIDNYVEMRWFVPSISRIEAENKLATEGKEGSFLVRPSMTKGSKYSLTLCHHGQVYHYRIWQNKSNEFSVDDNIHFHSLEELVEFYKTSKGGLCMKLCEYTPTTTSGLKHQTDKGSTIHFEEAMEHGYVECTMTTCAVTGAAGSGKSHTMYLALHEDPPDVRQSTGLVEPVRALSMVVGAGSSESGLKWSRVDEDKLLDIVAGATSVTGGKEQPEIQTSPSLPTHSTSKESFSTSLPLATSQDIRAQEHAESSSEAGISEQVSELELVSKLEQASHTEVVDELLIKLAGLLRKPSGKRQVTRLDFLYFLDSGGQPQFHELLPSFIPNLSTILFVVKLSEHLSQRPLIEYYEENKSVCSYRSPYSHEQILKHCIRALQPENRSIESGSSTNIAVVGTHRDLESQCEGETRQEKNQKLLDLLEPRFGDRLIFYHQLKELIYPVNAKNPSQEDRAVAGELREATIRSSASKPVQIPLPWFMLEQVLRKLAKERGTGVIHIDECREIANRLHIKSSAFDAALKYLVRLNVFLYYPSVLPNSVFCVPQVFLDKINELVEHRHILCGASTTLPGGTELTNTRGLSGKQWLSFQKYGVFTAKLLEDEAFSRHYDKDLFTPADFLKLLESLLIVGKVNAVEIHTEYVMPSLLFELESDKLDEYRSNPQTSPASPLLIHFPGEWPTSGVFCSLAASLLSTQNWKVMTDSRNNPTCVYRNCFQFEHPKMPGSITLIDSFDRGYFEVHINAPLEECKKYCPEIRQSLFAALPPKAPVEKEVAFFCPNSKRDEHCPSSLHLAYMKQSSDFWNCSESRGKVYGSLEEAPNMTVWGIAGNSASEKPYENLTVRQYVDLNQDNHIEITSYLLGLDKTHIYRLGLVLGLSEPRVRGMEDSKTFLDDMVVAWLQKVDQVQKRGAPSWRRLVEALRDTRVGQNGIAMKISQERIVNWN